MAIMGSIGLAIIYGFKVNVSVAIVAMVNKTAVKRMAEHDDVPSAVCGFNDTESQSEVNIIILLRQ